MEELGLAQCCISYFFNGPNPFVIYKLKDGEAATGEMEGRWSRALVLYQAWMVTRPGILASLWPHKKIIIILKICELGFFFFDI